MKCQLSKLATQYFTYISIFELLHYLAGKFMCKIIICNWANSCILADVVRSKTQTQHFIIFLFQYFIQCVFTHLMGLPPNPTHSTWSHPTHSTWWHIDTIYKLTKMRKGVSAITGPNNSPSAGCYFIFSKTSHKHLTFNII